MVFVVEPLAATASAPRAPPPPPRPRPPRPRPPPPAPAPRPPPPAHLRRAVIARDRCCAFPGCPQPPAACQVHHIRPRRNGGRTALPNLILLCPFHHLTAVHRWGWAITLHPDGTVTALSPDRQRTLHSHDPCRQHPHSHGPAAAAA